MLTGLTILGVFVGYWFIAGKINKHYGKIMPCVKEKERFGNPYVCYNHRRPKTTLCIWENGYTCQPCDSKGPFTIFWPIGLVFRFFVMPLWKIFEFLGTRMFELAQRPFELGKK